MNPPPSPRADLRIVREDDPEHARLTGLGWRVVSRSWGARLTLADDADVSALEAALAAVRRAGYAVRRLGGADLPALADLDERVGPDFPDTPASRHEPLPADLGRDLAAGRWLAFGASAPGGGLVAFTILRPEPDRWEVERTAVDAAHRRRGLATAVKAASILATRAAGARCWGTGGAGVNAGSLAVNRALGFELEPAWHALAPPPPA